MKHKVKVREVKKEEHAALTTDGRPGFISLRQVTENFGGFEFDFELADGTKVPVSLEKYRGRDLDSTQLLIEIESKPENEKDAADFHARADARHGKPRA
jgi:hypothetical protein